MQHDEFFYQSYNFISNLAKIDIGKIIKWLVAVLFALCV